MSLLFRISGAFILLQVGLLCLGTEQVTADETSRVLAGIRLKYARLPGLTAPYTREVITRSMSMLGNHVKGDLATGRICFKPPFYLRLEQARPRKEIMVADGKTLWWYIPEKKEVHQYPFQKFGKELKVLGDIFQGLVRVEETFRVSMPPQKGLEGYRIALTPDPPWQEIDRIVLTVGRSYDIREIDIHNPFGSITRFRLKEPIPQRLDTDFFRFSPLPGVKVIKE
ncbi:MAG: hypothetical protein DRH56_01890 [Deltaproteobacteria bacterium]|nr:MAG: hypothetical protein DRH56_01890 [Deltaproteobacteria bacterium]